MSDSLDRCIIILSSMVMGADTHPPKTPNKRTSVSFHILLIIHRVTIKSNVGLYYVWYIVLHDMKSVEYVTSNEDFFKLHLIRMVIDYIHLVTYLMAVAECPEQQVILSRRFKYYQELLAWLMTN